MKKFFKYGVVPAVTVIFLFTVTVILLPVLINVRQYIPEIEKQISVRIGRACTLGPDLSLSLFPSVSVSCSHLSIGNPEGFSSDTFMIIDSLEAKIKLLPLFRKQLRISRFVVGGLKVNLERNGDGRENWIFGGERTEQQRIDGWRGLSFLFAQGTGDLLGVTDGTVTWKDRVNNREFQISDLMVLLKDVTPDKPASLECVAAFGNTPVRLDGTIGPLSSLVRKNRLPVDLHLKMAELFNAGIKGRLMVEDRRPSWNFVVDIPSASPREIIEKFHFRRLLQFADSSMLNSLSLRTAINGSAQQMSFENGVVSFDESRLTFSGSVKNLFTPEIQFLADIDQINLDRYMSGGKKADHVQTDSGTNGEKLAPAGPQGFKVDGIVKAEKLIIREHDLSPAMIHLVVDENLLQADPLSFSLYSGNVHCGIAVNFQGEVVETSLNLLSEGVDVTRLLHDLFGREPVSGRGNMALNLSSSGTGFSEMLTNLEGRGALMIEKGILSGYDFQTVFGKDGTERQTVTVEDGPEDSGRLKTTFTGLSAEFVFHGGILENTSTSLQTPSGEVMVAGDIDFAGRTLDLQLVRSDLLEGGKGVKTNEKDGRFLRITGSFSEVLLVRGGDREGEALVEAGEKVDVKKLVDEQLPSPVDDDVKDLVGKALIAPEIVARRFGLQPEIIKREKEKRKFRKGSGKIRISPLRQEAFLQL
ncbi:AsmA family protein [Desulfomarina sp.]